MRRDERGPLTAELEAELDALSRRPVQAIDLEEMPEVTDWSGAVRGRLYRTEALQGAAAPRVTLPPSVAKIFEAIGELEAAFPKRKFTLDGHLAGSIGEVIAAEALKLDLHPMSHPGHDAFNNEGDVQIKLTGGRSVAMYSVSKRLVVLRIVLPREAEIVYDGPGAPAWDAARKMGKNGQRVVTLAALRKVAASAA